MSQSTSDEISRQAREQRDRLEPFFYEISKVIVGSRSLIERVVICLLAEGHLLLEGVPGLAKTLAVKAVASASRLEFKRVQFTPDLLPADVVGTQVYNAKTSEFTVKKGPIFANLVLADEINRAPAKVQSALLEAMQERQATIGETTFALPDPFLVLATQNPIEQEGTYPLPEAQVDRFMMKVRVAYPNREEELAIVDRMSRLEPPLAIAPVLEPADLASLKTAVDRVYVDEKIRGYIVDLVQATRGAAKELAGLIQVGASPRGSIALTRAAKALAFLDGRGYVVPQDVKTIAPDVLRHRLALSFEAEAENLRADDLIERLLALVPVP
jgi:MoxR-like ATPase